MPDVHSLPAVVVASQMSWAAPFSGVMRNGRMALARYFSQLSDSLAKLEATLPGWNAAEARPWAR
ncbi:hypothetical protein BVC93_12565 [Mycobacterium sp. MS1601]|nr:hypothetical protein BVC93_12565 [Mycobacterium sp. MS1601]